MALLLIRFTQPPYSNALTQDGVDFALAATNYGHDVKVLFEDLALLQLVKTESVKGIKNNSKRLASMPIFDIDDCYACKASAEAIKLNESLQNTSVIDELDCKWLVASEKLALIKSADHVVTF
jgi:tRNA 2-thiouridine synthesizing protein C